MVETPEQGGKNADRDSEASESDSESDDESETEDEASVARMASHSVYTFEIDADINISAPSLIDLVAAPTAGACVVPTTSTQPQTVPATKEKPAERSSYLQLTPVNNPPGALIITEAVQSYVRFNSVRNFHSPNTTRTLLITARHVVFTPDKNENTQFERKNSSQRRYNVTPFGDAAFNK
ncbi:hypothetical protein B0H13DRAFT_2355495 [Mycena leptocephala]|nr:hypothetical protein B0H13DRAFT_2355495 [Mycena leptocephala]